MWVQPIKIKVSIYKRPRECIHVYISDFQGIMSNMSLLVIDCGIIFTISKSCCFFKSIYWNDYKKHYSCIETNSYSCLHPLSNERKSMFKSGDSHAVWTWIWTWKYLKWALHYLLDVICGKRCGPDWSFRRCFCSRKRYVRLWRCDDVMTFESTQPTPFCLEKSSVRKWTI